jgi:hypothetical protein
VEGVVLACRGVDGGDEQWLRGAVVLGEQGREAFGGAGAWGGLAGGGCRG